MKARKPCLRNTAHGRTAQRLIELKVGQTVYISDLRPATARALIGHACTFLQREMSCQTTSLGVKVTRLT